MSQDITASLNLYAHCFYAQFSVCQAIATVKRNVYLRTLFGTYTTFALLTSQQMRRVGEDPDRISNHSYY